MEKQLSVIRDFVQAGDANRATELAFMLMSTVKDFSDGSFEEKSVLSNASKQHLRYL